MINMPYCRLSLILVFQHMRPVTKIKKKTVEKNKFLDTKNGRFFRIFFFSKMTDKLEPEGVSYLMIPKALPEPV